MRKSSQPTYAKRHTHLHLTAAAKRACMHVLLIATLAVNFLHSEALSQSFFCDDCYSQCCHHADSSAGSQLPPVNRYKDKFVQLWESEAAWIGANADFEQTEVNTFLRLAIPLDKSRKDNIVALQPGLRTYFLNGPEVVDVPAKLYDAQLSILWRKTFSERWQTSVWLQPKIRSDFEESQDSFFFSGGAFAKYGWKPGLVDLYFGAFYLDRDDVSVLPAIGFVYTPTPSTRYEVLLPRPKLAHRVWRCGERERWVYLGGQLGGGSFAVRRDSGESDKLTLRDFRLNVGLEQVQTGGAGWFVEAGYVFGRTIEYESSEQDFSFDDSVMLRVGLRI